MMVMDNYYNNTQQHPAEMLWRKINSLHLSYLEMEESPEKIEHKNKLEACIHSYLCVAHHNQKFECASTPQVLHASARVAAFSGYKAAVGWDAIGRYAANLITKPWRREYRQIKMYSGFYKHEVESNLVGADEMFIEMGYKHVDTQLLILTGPVCPDRLTSVSLDSIMAYVECQILKEIWEEVSHVYNVTWLDVLSLRETHAGSPRETITAMIYMKRMPQQVLPPAPKLIHPFPSSYQPPAPHSCCSNFYMHQHPQQYPPFNYYSPPLQHHHPHQQLQQTVPTGQLIELDAAMYDQPDGGRGCHDVHKKMSQLYINDAKKTEPSERDDGSGTYESWDYVYRNLESQGYSKDLGERGDLLQEELVPQSQTQPRPKPKQDRDKELQAKRERRDSKYSTYDNVSDKKTPTKPSSSDLPQLQQQHNGHSAVVVSAAQGWHCTYCTFLNPNDKDICVMCSKSRKKPVGSEHLQVGGTQCEACTFVNNKGQKKCTMCDNNLNNSPTYI